MHGVERQLVAMANTLKVTQLKSKIEGLDKQAWKRGMNKAQAVATLVQLQMTKKRADHAQQQEADDQKGIDLPAITDRFRASLTSLKDEARQATEEAAKPQANPDSADAPEDQAKRTVESEETQVRSALAADFGFEPLQLLNWFQMLTFFLRNKFQLF